MIDNDVREVWEFNAKRLGLKIKYGVVPKKVEKVVNDQGNTQYIMTLSGNETSSIEADFIL